MGEENENMGYDHEHRSSHDTLLNFPSAGMNANWDSIVSLSQNGNFGDFGIGNQGMVHYRNDSGFGSGGFPEMVGCFGLNEFGQTSNIGYHQNFGRSSVNGGILKGEGQVSEGKKGKSPSGKGKKRESESISSQSQSKGEQIEEMSIQHDEKKQKIEHNYGTSLPSKQTGKQVKDSSKNDDSAKDYIHVRARRGQATNSHSLAERVRRERISERMRLLQDLVPGCNKITGKAVMLDEIINYVQSLQQQVEFLSMKLATVNPEVNIDIDRVLSKELLQSRGSNVAIPGFGSGVNSPHPYPPTMLQGPFPGISNTSQFHQMPQNMLDHEIHNLLQMGFDSYPAINNLGPSGRQKMDI